MNDIEQLTDAELSTLVAEKVAGWVRNTGPNAEAYEWIRGNSYLAFGPTFATSADAVLPLLEKDGGCYKYNSALQRLTYFKDQDCSHPFCYDGFGPFARAACYALLRAHAAEHNGKDAL